MLSEWQQLANRLFPISAKHGQVRGDGAYLVISRCTRIWFVRLYPTAEERNSKLTDWHVNGCDKDCNLQHDKRTLTLPAPVPRHEHREPPYDSEYPER